MNEKFNKNAKVEKLIKKVGRGVRLIVIGPYTSFGIFCVREACLATLQLSEALKKCFIY